MKPRTRLTALALTALCGVALIVYWQHKTTPSTANRPSETATNAAAPVVGATAPAPVAANTPTAPAPKSAAAFPSLLAGARVGFPGRDARPVVDRFEKAPTIWSTERAGGANGELIQRIRLVRTQMKYPLVRLEEVLRRIQTNTGSQEELLLQLAMVGDHVLVKPNANLAADQFAASVERVGGKVRTRLRASGNYLVEIAATNPESMPQQLAALRSTGVAPVAEPDYIVHTCVTPNDPEFSLLWGMNNTGGANGTADADIDAPEAWDIATGSRSVIVGIIDSGIDYTHPDLAANIWTNPGEIAGNRIDDDNNGFIDDIHGWDFCNDDSDPMDDNRHGTHCAGTIGAVGNNGIGVVGVNWQASLVALKFLSSSGSGSISDAVEAVTYANQIGVTLTSNSWGGGGYSQILKDAIDAAGATGHLFVAAAGNDGSDNDHWSSYPASYSSSNIIAVAATNAYDNLAGFSNYGATTVDLAAPGVAIYSTLPGGLYDYLSGTSMATPHVAGAVALMKSAHPLLSASNLKDLLLASVDPVPSLEGYSLSGGRLNLNRALQAGDHLVVPMNGFAASGPVGGPFDQASTQFSLRNLGATAIPFTIVCDKSWMIPVPTTGVVPANSTATFTVSLTPSAAQLLPAEHAGTIRITETGTGFITTRRATLSVRPPPVYSFTLDSDPGWERTGQWAFGQPLGLGGKMGGYNDPYSAHTGTNVFGINLAGDYVGYPGEPEYLIAGPFNLKNYARTRLRFSRWLNTEGGSFSFSQVEVSTDKVSWAPIWQTWGMITDSEWTKQTLDLSSYADDQATVYVRWSHQTLDYTGGYSGWNIDDIEILGLKTHFIEFAPLGPVNESIGTVAATLRIDPATTEPTTITLSSSLPGTVSVPATVFAPAGATAVPVTLTVHDDSLLNGTRDVSLGISADLYVGRTAHFLIQDTEKATLGLALPASGSEGGPATTGTITCSPAPVADVTVQLSSTPSGRVELPASVVLPAGATSVTFPISFPNNDRIDRTIVVGVVASVANWGAGTGNITVSDDESIALTLTLPGEVSESDGVLTDAGTVRISGALATPLTIALSSSDTTELAVPTAVSIPAGATSASFNLSPQNDYISDGAQNVRVTATAAGFSPGQTDTVVADATVHHFTFDFITSPQSIGMEFPVQIIARDQFGNIATGYRGAVSVTAQNTGTPVPLGVSVGATFSRGTWSGSVVILAMGESITLRTFGEGAEGTSNPFSVTRAVIEPHLIESLDIAYSPLTQRLYAATASGTLIVVNPDTGYAEASIPVATSALSKLAVSDDGSQLYAAHTNGQQITRVPLATLVPAEQFSVGTGNQRVWGLAPVPGEPTSVAVAIAAGIISRRAEQISVFDHGVPKSNTFIPAQNIQSIAAGRIPGRIYAISTDNTGSLLSRTQVDSAGISLVDQRPTTLQASLLAATGDLLADSSGHLIDGETFQAVATLPHAGLACIDSAAQRVFLLRSAENGTQGQYRLDCYDSTTFEQIGQLTIPDVDSAPSKLVHCGQGILAFLTNTKVFILRTAFVTSPTAADLSLTVVDSPNPAIAGELLSYSIRVANLGGTTASNINLTNVLPAGATFVSATASQGSLIRSGREITVNLGSLSAGNSAVVNIRVTPDSTTELVNSATVLASTADPTTANNHVTTRTAVSAPTPLMLRQVDLGANTLASDGQHLFVALSSNSRLRANSIASIDPATLAIENTFPIGNDPNIIQLTDDRTHAHVALRGSCAMRPVDLASSAAGSAVLFAPDAVRGPQYAIDLTPLAGGNTTVAVNRRFATTYSGALSVYNGITPRGSILETTGMFRPARGASPNRLHVMTDSPTGDLSTYSLTAAGLSLERKTQGIFSSTYNMRLKNMGDTLVSYLGEIIDAANHEVLAQIAACDAIATDADNHRIFCLKAGYDAKIIAYETTNWSKVAELSLGDFGVSVTEMVRWGRKGFAFTTYEGRLFSFEAPSIVPDPPLRVILPAAVNEGAGLVVGGGRVELVYPTDTPLTVILSSSAPAILAVPAAVVIPQGAKSATFDLVVADNNRLNGTRNIIVTPAATGLLTPYPGIIAVHDDEVATISLAMTATISEGTADLLGNCTVTLSAQAGEDIDLNLVASNPADLVVPRRVTIPAGQQSTTFKISAPDNDWIDGTRLVSVAASMTNWAPASATVAVEDNDASTLTLAIPSTIPEGQAIWGTVNLSARTKTPISITLQSTLPDSLIVDTVATIIAGTKEANIYLSAINNNEPTAARPVSITATAPGFTSATAHLKILDDDPASIEWDPITGPVVAGEKLNTLVTLRTVDGDPATGFWGEVAIGARNEKGPAIVVSQPAGDGAPGQRLLGSTVQTAGTQTRLVAALPTGITGESNAFVVKPNTTTGFHWDTVPSPRQAGITFPVTIRSADRFGNPTSDFAGTAALSALMQTATRAIGTDTSYRNTFPIGTFGRRQSRMTMLLTQSEIGQAGVLRSLALDLASAQPCELQNFTIRLKHSTRIDYESDPRWESAGWTVVYQRSTTIYDTGPATFEFSTPFAYNGTSNLLVDFSFNNTSFDYNNPLASVNGSYCSPSRAIQYGSSETSAGDPLAWNGVTPGPTPDSYQPNIVLKFGTSTTLTPLTTTAFANGVWSGPVSVSAPATDVLLTAVNGTMLGRSNVFNVVPAIGAPTIAPEPSYTAGTTNTIDWSAVVGATGYQAQCATSAAFTDPTESSWLSPRTFTCSALTDATTYFFRVRASSTYAGEQVVGPWSPVVSSTQDASAPVITITSRRVSATAAYTILGTASDTSGVASLTVAGAASTTTDGYAHWSRAVTLQPGANTFLLRATDRVSPAQTSTQSVTIFRLPSLGDSDGDGFSDLLEYALGLDPAVATGTGGPTTALQTNPGDGLSYLMFTYRRRVLRDGLTYHVETAPDLSTWTEVANPVEVAATPNGDGLTETVTVRLQPAISAATPRRFVRLKVTTP